MNNDLKLAYLAGYFDGEGCITFTGGRSDTKGYSPKMVLTGTKLQGLNLAKQMFGGRFQLANRSKVNPNHKDCYHWELAGYVPCREFLKRIIPFLLVKKEQAILMTEYIELRLEPMKITHNPLTKDQAKMRDKLFLMNGRSIKIAQAISRGMKLGR